jgi:hypothetical protein
MDELKPIPCPACGGSGRTRRFRLMPLLAAITVLLFIVLGEVLRHVLGAGPEKSQADAALVGLGLGFAYLVFAGSLIALFRRGECPECHGRGTRRDVPGEMPLIARQDRVLSHPGNCRHCGYNLTGNESGRCPECGTPVLRI